MLNTVQKNSMKPAEIIAFKDLLRARFPEAHALKAAAPVVQTGVPCLDAIGISAGGICEIVSSCESSGAGLLLVSLLGGENEAARQPVALVDAADAFNPVSVTDAALEQLLWVRCRAVHQAVQATDLLLRDGNISRVLLDLQWCPPREVRGIHAPVWHRLRMLAEKSGAALCAFTPFQTVPCARSRLLLETPQPMASLHQDRDQILSHLHGKTVRTGLTMPASKPAWAAAG